jgi:serine/threonine protein kinase
MITWVGAVILMFSRLCQTRRKNSCGQSHCRLHEPARYADRKGKRNLGLRSGEQSDFMHYPDFLLVGVAVVISHVITKLGQVAKAREMGSYRLVRLLGRGGMGEVWRARHRTLARDAAIKLIKPEMLSQDSGSKAVLMQRRFEQEARATASLRSPHTVELYDFGVTEDGVFYYVMELLDGIDLETLEKRFGPQPAARVVWILRQVCGSLAEAHRQGMIHRDIKPTNIFLCRMGNEYDFAKVLDFGLVKMLDETDARITDDGRPTTAVQDSAVSTLTPEPWNFTISACLVTRKLRRIWACRKRRCTRT